MKNLMLHLLVLALVVGCKQASEPVASRPTEVELFGNWTLINSPKVFVNSPVPIPTKGNSSILLISNVAKLTNVAVPSGGVKSLQFSPVAALDNRFLLRGLTLLD